MKNGNKKRIYLLFLLPLLIASLDDSDWYYERNSKVFCPHRDQLCYSNITYNNPYTPKIPGDFLNTAILYPHYHYIYLIFSFPKNQTQRKFYLEATDITKNETVISNGDIYLININNIYEYELRIYKPVLSNTTIQLQFLGLNPGFFMYLKIKFARDLSIYFNGVMLTDHESLNKSDIPELNESDEKLLEKIKKQNERKAKAIETANKILTNLFGKEITTDIEFKGNIYTEIIPLPFFIVTISISVGLEESTENFFKPTDEEKTLLDLVSFSGDISIESNMFETPFSEYISINNFIFNSLSNLVKVFNKKVNDLIINIGLETEIYSLTISYSLVNNYISLIYRFFEPVYHKVFYEIEIKFELNNDNWFIHKVTSVQAVFSDAINKAAEFDQKYGKDLTTIILVMIAATIIIAAIILCIPFIGGIVAVIGAGVAAVGSFIANLFNSFEIPFEPVFEFVKVRMP